MSWGRSSLGVTLVVWVMFLSFTWSFFLCVFAFPSGFMLLCLTYFEVVSTWCLRTGCCKRVVGRG